MVRTILSLAHDMPTAMWWKHSVSDGRYAARLSGVTHELTYINGAQLTVVTLCEHWSGVAVEGDQAISTVDEVDCMTCLMMNGGPP